MRDMEQKAADEVLACGFILHVVLSWSNTFGPLGLKPLHSPRKMKIRREQGK
jgi:hypothetical protein